MLLVNYQGPSCRALLIWLARGDAGRRLAGLTGGPLRKLLELLQEAHALVDACCKPGKQCRGCGACRAAGEPGGKQSLEEELAGAMLQCSIARSATASRAGWMALLLNEEKTDSFVAVHNAILQLLKVARTLDLSLVSQNPATHAQDVPA